MQNKINLLRLKRPGDPILADEWNALVRLATRELHGPNVIADDGGWTLLDPEAVGGDTPAGVTGIWARLVNWAFIDIPTSSRTHQYRYGWIESIWEETNRRWVDKPGGLAGDRDVEAQYAINSIEGMNTGTDTQGHGVNVSSQDYPSNFNMQPAGGGRGSPTIETGTCLGSPIVWMTQIPIYVQQGQDWVDTGNLRWVFQYENADDGLC